METSTMPWNKHRLQPLLLGVALMALTCLRPVSLEAATALEPKNRPPCTTGAPPVNQPAAEAATQESTEATPGNIDDLDATKQRYDRDPTGARARLGLCGRGKGGPGCGRHRGHHGGNQWRQP